LYATGSKALIRDLNRSAVLNLIKREGPISRVEISRMLGLSGASVTSIAGELEGLGLIRTVAHAPSDGGRPRRLIALNPDAACVIGIKLQVDQLAAVIVDLEANPLVERVEVLSGHGFDTVLAATADLVSSLREAAGGRALLGVGIGMPGVIDGPNGVCVDSPMLGWRNAPIVDRMSGVLGLPVVIDNDVNTLAVAEQLYGKGHDVDDFVVVTLGRGVGCGIVVGRQLVRGRLGGAGEFGHMPIDTDGPLCECGRRGCLEAFIGDLALARTAVEAGVLPPGSRAVDLAEKANRGDATCRSILAEAGGRLGTAIAGLANLLSPSLVLISGEGTRAHHHIETRMRSALERNLFPPLSGLEVMVDPWDDTRWARGAAALVLEAFFSAGRQVATNGGAVDLADFAASVA
jgi:predicted NBD/HSP70 family sugar kinase